MKFKVNIKDKTKEFKEKWNKLPKKNKWIVYGVLAVSALGLCCVPLMKTDSQSERSVLISNENSTSKDKETSDKQDKDESKTNSESDDNSTSNTNKDTDSNSNNTTSDSNKKTTSADSNEADTSNSTSSSSTSSAQPNQTSEQSHTHSWKEVTTTVHHDAVTHTEKVLVSEAYDEPTYETVYKDICNDCGADITGFANEHLLETEHGSFTGGVPYTYQTGVIHHGAIYDDKTVVDQAAWNETVVSGYVCTECGQTK